MLAAMCRRMLLLVSPSTSMYVLVHVCVGLVDPVADDFPAASA